MQARWETERTIDDPREHEDAVKTRNKISSMVRGICAHTAFGLLCPESDAAKLETAMVDARKEAELFNEYAKLTRIHVYLMTGRVAPDDVEAVRAINSEVRDLLEKMENGISNLDVKAVREAANKARQVGSMLSDNASERIKDAITTARDAARKIVKAGEQTAQEIDLQAIQAIKSARTAFLDLGDVNEVAVPVVASRTVDLAPETEENSKPGRFTVIDQLALED
jgi:hypothetical protein